MTHLNGSPLHRTRMLARRHAPLQTTAILTLLCASACGDDEAQTTDTGSTTSNAADSGVDAGKGDAGDGNDVDEPDAAAADPEGSRDVSRSGIERGKRWSDITDEDAKKFCLFESNAILKSLPKTKEAYCLAAWVEPSSCAADLADCQKSGEYEDQIAPWNCSQFTAAAYFMDYPSCDVLIEDFEDCVVADAAQDRSLYESASCDSPKIADTPLVPECEKALAACPAW